METSLINNGDHYNPLGMKGTKKIQDLFTDKKIDRIKRHNLPIIYYNNKQFKRKFKRVNQDNVMKSYTVKLLQYI